MLRFRGVEKTQRNGICRVRRSGGNIHTGLKIPLPNGRDKQLFNGLHQGGIVEHHRRLLGGRFFFQKTICLSHLCY